MGTASRLIITTQHLPRQAAARGPALCPPVQITPLERTALQFIFDALDNPTRSGVAAAAAAAKEALAASAAGAALLARGAKGKRGKKASAGGSKGFGGGSAGGKGFGKA